MKKTQILRRGMRELLFIPLLVFLTIGEGNAQTSPIQGRLTGWGKMGNGQNLEDTLPAGWDAENIVAVSAGQRNWIALKADGSVVTGGADGWARNQPPSWVGKCKAVDIGTGAMLAIRLDGTLAVWGAEAADLRARADRMKDVVSVTGGYQHVAAVTEDGALHFWGPWYDSGTDSGKALAPIVTKVREMTQNVTAVNSGHGAVSALKQDGSVFVWNYRNGSKGFQPH